MTDQSKNLIVLLTKIEQTHAQSGALLDPGNSGLQKRFCGRVLIEVPNVSLSDASSYSDTAEGAEDGRIPEKGIEEGNGPSNLDLARRESQTRSMAHTTSIYIRFDFGTDEEKAQQARHKLDGWRQAFRLDKRVQYKMDRPESEVMEAASKAGTIEKPTAAGKSKEKPAGKAQAKTGGKSGETASAKTEAATNGKVGLLVRLYFSSHEKLSEQRWLERIPSEEPFKSAGPKVIHQDDPEFEATDQQFESLN